MLNKCYKSEYIRDIMSAKLLNDLNLRLKKLQHKLLGEAIKLDSELKKRVDDANDVLYDYEIEWVIDFYLKEDDKNFKEDEDNIITTIKEYKKGISEDIEYAYLRWEENHNEFGGQVEHPLADEHHCWWYHCLYDHNRVSFEDIARIGTIWSDIKVYYQYLDKWWYLI